MTPDQTCSREGAAPALLLEGLGLGLELMAAGRNALTQLQEGARRVASSSTAGSSRFATVPGLRHLAGGGLQAALKGGALAALIEMPVALAAGGKMVAAAMAGGAGAGLAYGLGSLGLGGLLVPIAPALLVVGVASVAVSSGIRLRTALAFPDSPTALQQAPPSAVLDLSRGQVVRGNDVWFALPAD